MQHQLWPKWWKMNELSVLFWFDFSSPLPSFWLRRFPAPSYVPSEAAGVLQVSTEASGSRKISKKLHVCILVVSSVVHWNPNALRSISPACVLTGCQPKSVTLGCTKSKLKKSLVNSAESTALGSCVSSKQVSYCRSKFYIKACETSCPW